MKYILITVVIAIFAGTSGYFLGVNKSNLEETLTRITAVEKNEKFTSETIFQVSPYGTVRDAMMSHQFFQTEFAVIKSQENLSRAIDDYDLEKLLGKNKEELIKEIAGSVEIVQERGTDLIRLEVSADSELKAQQIAYAVTQTYSTRRTEALNKRRLETMNVFKDKRRIQEDKVEDHRTRLYALSKRLQIPYHGRDARLYANRDSDANEYDRSNQAYEEAKRTKDGLESFVSSLNGLGDEQLMVTLMASGRPEAAVLKTDYDQLSGYKQSKTTALSSGLGINHITIKTLNVSINEIDERLARSVVSVRQKLAQALMDFNQNVEKLRVDSNREEGDLM